MYSNAYMTGPGPGDNNVNCGTATGTDIGGVVRENSDSQL